MQKRSLIIGFWFMIIAAFCGAIVANIVKEASFFISILTIFLLTRIFPVLTIIPSIGKKENFKTSRIGLLFLMAFFYASAFFLYIYSFKFIILVNASLLINSAPLYVPFIAYFWIGEKLTKKEWIGIFISFIGVVLILQPGFGVFSPYSLLAFLSGVLMAACQVTTRVLSKTEPAIRITNYMVIFCFLFAFLGLIAFDRHIFTEINILKNHLLWFFILIFTGTLSWAYQYFRIKAVVYAPVSKVMPFSFFGVLFVAIFAWIFFHEIPNVFSVIGAIFVIIGTTIVLKYKPIKE